MSNFNVFALEIDYILIYSPSNSPRAWLHRVQSLRTSNIHSPVPTLTCSQGTCVDIQSLKKSDVFFWF